MEYSKLKVVFFNCLNSVGILCFILISTYFVTVDKILQTVPEHEIDIIVKHIFHSLNYVYFALPKESIDILITNISIQQSKSNNNIYDTLQKEKNRIVKRTAEMIFYSIGAITFFFSLVWYLVMVEFDIVKMIVACISNIINVGFMGGIEILFLYLCAPHFIALYPAFIDNFVLGIIRSIYCYDIPQNPTYYDLLLYIYFMNDFYYGDQTIAKKLENYQSLQNYTSKNPQSVNFASGSAAKTGKIAQIPRRNTST